MDRLRTRKSDGQATTEKDLKKAGVWKANTASSTATGSEALSPLDTPERLSRSSSLSSLSSIEEQSIIPFPELNVPPLELELPRLHTEQSLRRQKTKPLTLTSTIPDYNLDVFFSLAEPKNAMLTETPQIFHSDGRKSENPADFLKSFNRAMRQQSITTSIEKVEAFGDYLGTGSDTELWFKALMQNSKATWPAFVTAFEDRWPPIVVAEKTKAEYERELMEHLLSDAEVGTKTTLHDRECWTARSLGRQGAAVSVESWNSNQFFDDMADLKGNRVLEKKEQHSKQEHEVNRLRADVARLQQNNPTQSSLAALQNQFARIQPAAPTQPLVITEDMKNLIQQLVSSSSHHPDTPAGHAAYATQIAQWNAKWGEYTRVTPETGYPLKPGTAAIASKRLSRKEAAWRAIVSKALGSFNRATAIPISLVTNHTPHYTSAWIEEIPEQEEGKSVDLYSAGHIATTKDQLDSKEARETLWGGMETPPLRQVISSTERDETTQPDLGNEHLQTQWTKPSAIAMGKWTPTFQFKSIKADESERMERKKERTKRENVQGSEKLPSREVQNASTSPNANMQIDKPFPALETTHPMQMIECRADPNQRSQDNQKEAKTEVEVRETQVNKVGSIKLPSREVQPHIPNSQQLDIDLPGRIARITEINVITEETDQSSAHLARTLIVSRLARFARAFFRLVLGLCAHVLPSIPLSFVLADLLKLIWLLGSGARSEARRIV
ncbi:hypothetical protein EV424DRAFT_1345369 [Suillus variegatus]|nr:hypothetical protein EV424DRAFT_1345369 [Suillus variegatus]